MAIHSKETFLVPISKNDNKIFIQDSNRKKTFEFNPWRVTATYHQSLYILVKMQGSADPSKIKFQSINEALESLTILQSALDLLKSDTTDIPKEITNYINLETSKSVNNSQFSFRQETASDTWVVGPHTLGKMGAVTVTNDDLETIIGYVKHVDNENVLIKFNQALSGWVFIS